MKSKEIKSLVLGFGQGLDYFQLTFGAKAGQGRPAASIEFGRVFGRGGF